MTTIGQISGYCHLLPFWLSALCPTPNCFVSHTVALREPPLTLSLLSPQMSFHVLRKSCLKQLTHLSASVWLWASETVTELCSEVKETELCGCVCVSHFVVISLHRCSEGAQGLRKRLYPPCSINVMGSKLSPSLQDVLIVLIVDSVSYLLSSSDVVDDDDEGTPRGHRSCLYNKVYYKTVAGQDEWAPGDVLSQIEVWIDRVEPIFI